jgi:hypothetical protein
MRDWDWTRPNTINLYEYVGNDPISVWDPWGFEWYYLDQYDDEGNFIGQSWQELPNTPEITQYRETYDENGNHVGTVEEIVQGVNLTIPGFDSERYNTHDLMILDVVTQVNQNPASEVDMTNEQASCVDSCDPRLVKSQMIQETGGNDPVSLAAWYGDPLQVNVPGDWNPYKESLGLQEPTQRNEGDIYINIRAGVVYLIRKGFAPSAQPPSNAPNTRFDGYQRALERYNGRTVITTNGLPYMANYAARIMLRSISPQTVPIPLPQPAANTGRD